MTAHPVFRHGRMLSSKKRVSREQNNTKGHDTMNAANHSKGEHFHKKVFTLGLCMIRVAVWVSGAFLLISTAYVSYAIFFTNSLERYGIGLFILLSSLLAISFGFIGWIVTSKLTVATNTVNAIHQSRISENLEKHKTAIENAIENQPFSIDMFEAEDSTELRTSTYSVLNYLEFVSLAIREGHYNERLCRLYYKGIFKNNFLKTRLVIEKCRVENPKTFENFVHYVHRWHPDMPS